MYNSISIVNMNVERTPPGRFSGSHPNLTNLKSIEPLSEHQVTFRKRKNPHEFDPEEFACKLDETLAKIRENIVIDVNNSLSAFRENMTTFFHNVIETQNENIKHLTNRVSDFTSQVGDLKQTSNKLEIENKHMSNKIDLLKSDSTNLHSKVLALEKQLNDCNSTITNLSSQLCYNDQQCRMNNLEICGIPTSKSENLLNILQIIATKAGISLESCDIDHINRVRRFSSSNGNNTQTPNIVVKFTQRRKKCDFLAAVRARRGLTTADLDIDGPAKPVFVNEHLTSNNKYLYSQARKLGKECGFAYIWIKDCKIFVRKSDVAKAILIASESDLTKIK